MPRHNPIIFLFLFLFSNKSYLRHYVRRGDIFVRKREFYFYRHRVKKEKKRRYASVGTFMLLDQGTACASQSVTVIVGGTAVGSVASPIKESPCFK